MPPQAKPKKCRWGLPIHMGSVLGCSGIAVAELPPRCRCIAWQNAPPKPWAEPSCWCVLCPTCPTHAAHHRWQPTHQSLAGMCNDWVPAHCSQPSCTGGPAPNVMLHTCDNMQLPPGNATSGVCWGYNKQILPVPPNAAALNPQDAKGPGDNEGYSS